MARNKTQNIPDLTALLTPQNQLMVAVEQALLRGHRWMHASVPVAEQIAARLAGVITLNLVKAGQRLLETDISEVLHVSRAPVREALRILERDRLVEFESRRGAVVTAPDAAELRDIFVVRRALYRLLLEQLMADRPADLEAVLAQHMPTLIAAAEHSVEDYTVESFLLTFAMTDLGANRLLADLLQSISLRTLRYVLMGLSATPEVLPAWVRSWRALQRAVVKRDVDGVLEVAVRRIDNVRDAAISALGGEAHQAGAFAKSDAAPQTARGRRKTQPTA